jgi:hypothetical protein
MNMELTDREVERIKNFVQFVSDNERPGQTYTKEALAAKEAYENLKAEVKKILKGK